MVAKIKAPTTWYNYLYMFPDETVFYVGKGQKGRIDEHEKEAQTGCLCEKCKAIRIIWKCGHPVRKRIVFETLVEDEAIENEKKLIVQYDSEYLTNIVHNQRKKVVDGKKTPNPKKSCEKSYQQDTSQSISSEEHIDAEGRKWISAAQVANIWNGRARAEGIESNYTRFSVRQRRKDLKWIQTPLGYLYLEDSEQNDSARTIPLRARSVRRPDVAQRNKEKAKLSEQAA